jgi:hypothetical protein
MNELRIVKRKDGSEWTTIRLNELKSGDTFIMFDSPNEQVGGEWLAESDPAMNQSGVWGIAAKQHFGVEE